MKKENNDDKTCDTHTHTHHTLITLSATKKWRETIGNTSNTNEETLNMESMDCIKVANKIY